MRANTVYRQAPSTENPQKIEPQHKTQVNYTWFNVDRRKGRARGWRNRRTMPTRIGGSVR